MEEATKANTMDAEEKRNCVYLKQKTFVVNGKRNEAERLNTV